MKNTKSIFGKHDEWTLTETILFYLFSAYSQPCFAVQDDVYLRTLIQSMFYQDINRLPFSKELEADQVIVASALAKHLDQIWSSKGKRFEFSDWMVKTPLEKELILIPEDMKSFYSEKDYSEIFKEYHIIALRNMLTWV